MIGLTKVFKSFGARAALELCHFNSAILNVHGSGWSAGLDLRPPGPTLSGRLNVHGRAPLPVIQGGQARPFVDVLTPAPVDIRGKVRN